MSLLHDAASRSRMTRMMRTTSTFSGTLPQAITGTVILTALLVTSGCVRRKLNITSTPEGALVYLNDREVGRTPLDIDITYYGTYDVRLLRDGYEPLMTHGDASGPLWDLPGPDLIAELLPIELTSTIDWHYEMEPEDNDANALVSRARSMQASFQDELSQEAQQPPETISEIPSEDQGPEGLQMIDLAESDDEAIEPAQDDAAQEVAP